MTAKHFTAALLALVTTSGCYTASSVESPVDRAPRGSADRAELELPAPRAASRIDWEEDGRSAWAMFGADRPQRQAR
jgi:hypothetical protein